MYINTTGLILRETPYKETSKILTILTADEGKITAAAKGARRKGSKTAAATQLLAFSNLTLLQSRGRWTLTEAQSIELFSGLTSDIELLSLGSYFAQVLEAVSDADTPSPQFLALGLNALYALGEGKHPPELVKAAFELRLMSLAGFAPAVDECGACGRQDIAEPVFDIEGGTVYCRDCATGQNTKMCPGSLAAMRHVTGCVPKKIFSFTLASESLARLVRVSEEYVKTHLDRDFRTLDFYKSIRTKIT